MSRRSAASAASLAMNRARQKKLSPERRTAIARQAALARWAREREARSVPKNDSGEQEKS